ncbi:AraC family transcriptional regulator [uncultured Draconibacterium sp.]|uniref:helix-turn-helix domain-containing protein n=1 Tax=uncultured Draconibacterium sp. TaxID=1573823 RepID=UPI002AA67E1B|nr:AraC family transcriptional regulator [uncultured Draconibacterium sp.]
MSDLRLLFYVAPLIIILFWTINISIGAIKNKHLFKLPLILFFVDSLLAVFESGIFYFGEMDLFKILYIPAVFVSLSMFPLFYIYISSLIDNKKFSGGLWLKHLLFPFFNTIIAFVVLFIFMETAERNEFFHRTLVFKEGAHGIQKFAFYMDDVFRKIFLVTAVFYYAITDRKIRQHKARLHSYFSDTYDNEITWFPTLRISFFLTLISAFVYFSVQRYSTLNLWIIPAISHTLLSIFFWIIGYYGNLQNEITLHIPENNTRVDNTALTDEIFVDLDRRMEECMIAEKLFLTEGLSLPELARHIGTNRSYLSRYFNEYLKQTYSFYINSKRIEYACELMKNSEEELVLSAIYEKCGFNSNASFYRWFKEICKMSPQKFREEME